MNIDGKTVLVTGGKGALGNAVSNSLAKRGAHIVVFDRIPLDEEDYYMVDLCSEEDVEHIVNKLDHVDILINCAGEIYSEPCVNVIKREIHKRESWDRVINNNLTSCFNVSAQVARKMLISRTKGVIINFSSISAQGNAGQIAYAASKAGVEAITKTLSKELGLFKIRCVAIAPGFINTQSTRDSLPDNLIEFYEKNTPLRMLGHTDDIVRTIEYIIECDYLNGCVIPVDGGLRL